MTAATDFVFYLAFAGLIAHELDAVHKREWRLLFVLRSMPEAPARTAFVLAHVPLLAVLLWLLSRDGSPAFWTAAALDVFMAVHAGLHWRLSARPEYDFHSASSRLLIYGTAAVALAHLGLLVLVGWAR